MLIDLPPELQLSIASLLSPTDVYHLSLTCHSLEGFVKTNRRDLPKWDVLLEISSKSKSHWQFAIRLSPYGEQHGRQSYDEIAPGQTKKMNSLGLAISTVQKAQNIYR
jgi:hypothetical protein